MDGTPGVISRSPQIGGSLTQAKIGLGPQLVQSPVSTTIESTEGKTRWSMTTTSVATPDEGVFARFFGSRRKISTQNDQETPNQYIPDLKEKFRACVVENANLRERVGVLEDQLKIYQDQGESLAKTNDYCDTLLSRNSELEMLIAKIQDESQERLEQLRDTSKQLNSELMDLRAANRNLKGDHENLETYRTRILESNQYIDNIEKENNQLRETLSALKREVVDLNSQLSVNSANEHGEGLSELIKRFESLTSTSETIEFLAKENADLQIKYSEARKSLEEAQLEFAHKSAEMEHEASRAKVDLRTTVLKMNNVTLENDELKSRLANQSHLENELSDLRAQAEEKKLIQSKLVDAQQNCEIMQRKFEIYGNIHGMAQEILNRNRELERTSKNSIEVQEAIRARNKAEGLLRTAQREVSLLEKRLKATQKRLDDATSGSQTPNKEMDARALESSMNTVLETSKVHFEKRQNLLKERYDELIRDLRQSHAHEMEALAERLEREKDEANSMIRAEWSEKLSKQQRDFLLTFEKETGAIRDQELEKFESYKTALQREHDILLERQKQVWEQRLRDREQMANEARAEFEAQILMLEREKDDKIADAASTMQSILLKKDAQVSRLKASLESMAAHRDSEKGGAQFSTIRDLQTHINQLTIEFNESLRAEKERMKSIQSKHDAELNTLLKEKDAEINRLRTFINENSESQTPDHEALPKLLANATGEMSARLRALEAAHQKSLQEQENSALLLADADRARSELEEKINTSQEEIRKLTEKIRSSDAEFGNLTQQMQSLVNQNHDLEELLATASEHHHDELTTHLNTISNLMNDNMKLRTSRRARDDSNSRTSVIRQDLDETLDRLSRVEREKLHMQEMLTKSMAKIRDLQQAPMRAHDQSQVRDQVLRDISSLRTTLNKCLDLTQREKENSIALAQAKAARIRLEGEIEYLKQEEKSRLSRIQNLEQLSAKLRELPETDEERDALKTTVRELRAEREHMLADYERMERELNEQAATMRVEIDVRNERLQVLESTNNRMQQILNRNTTLENEIMALMDRLKERFSVQEGHSPTMDSIEVLLASFQEDIMNRTRSYREEMRNLMECVENRDAELVRLRNELVQLKSDLHQVFNAKSEAARVRHEFEQSQLKAENEELKAQRERLDHELAKMKDELVSVEEFNESRVTTMVEKLLSQVQEQQLIVAEVQEDRDEQVRLISSTLQASESSQKKLALEIQTIKGALEQKDSELCNLNQALRDIMELTKCAPSDGVELPDRIDGLKSKFTELTLQLSKSQKEADDLMRTLEALLDAHDQEIQRVTSSQRELKQFVAGARRGELPELEESERQVQEYLEGVSSLAGDQRDFLKQVKDKADVREVELQSLNEHLADLATEVQSSHGVIQTNLHNLDRSIELGRLQELNNQLAENLSTGIVRRRVSNTSRLSTEATRTTVSTTTSVRSKRRLSQSGANSSGDEMKRSKKNAN